MARWKIPPILHSEIGAGPLCPFHAHSIGCRDGRIPRYSDSHACVRCVAGLTEGRVSLDVHAIHKTWRRRFLEFWSFVDIRHPDECWPWMGQAPNNSPGGTQFQMPRFWNSGRHYSAQRIATWFTWGDIGRLPIKPLCGNANCINPLHIRIVGVPHFYVNRELQTIDLEFNARKLTGETHLFVKATKEMAPKRFRSMQFNNKEWLEQRVKSEGPLSSDKLIHISDEEL